jgi:DNA-nicking Smr family endonuclease
MAKRQSSRQQRRVCPDYRRPRPERGRTGERPQPRPQPRLTKSGLPILREEDLASHFGGKSVQESFAELVEESLAAPEARRALEEKRLGSPRRRAEADRLREYPAPQEELDLHRLTGPEAAFRIESFIMTARGLGLRTLRIITGRGLHSEGPAVLPEVAEHRLIEFKERGLVRAYRWEKKQREQSGALIVYLM